MQKNFWPFLIVTAVLGVAILIGFRAASKPLADKATAVAPGSASADHGPSSIAADYSIVSPQNPATASSAPQIPASPNLTTTAPHPPVTTLTSPQRIHEEIAAAADDTTPESLALLVSYASDENADVRTPALNGLIRRGDADAAPFLRAAAKKTDSSEAAIAMLKTADYLELPAATLREIAAKPKPLKAASPAGPFTRPAKPATPDPEDKP